MQLWCEITCFLPASFTIRVIQTCFNCVAGLHISNKSCSDPQEQVNEHSQPLLTYEKVGVRGGGTVLLLEELVEEGGETCND